MTIQLKLQRIEELAIRAKNRDEEATEELILLFTPLIYKISKTIHLRYGRIFPINDIIELGKCCLIQLTIYDYTPGGRAHYPYFLKKHIHAEMVNVYRPIWNYARRAEPLDNMYIITDPLSEICHEESTNIHKELLAYIEEECNDREKDIIAEHIIKHIPRSTLATKYHISSQRMKIIHEKMIKKLKKHLYTCGVTEIDI